MYPCMENAQTKEKTEEIAEKGGMWVGVRSVVVVIVVKRKHGINGTPLSYQCDNVTLLALCGDVRLLISKDNPKRGRETR